MRRWCACQGRRPSAGSVPHGGPSTRAAHRRRHRRLRRAGLRGRLHPRDRRQGRGLPRHADPALRQQGRAAPAVLEESNPRTVENGLADVSGLDYFRRLPEVMAAHQDNRGLLELFTTIAAEASSPAHPAHVFIAQRYTTNLATLAGRLREAVDVGDVNLSRLPRSRSKCAWSPQRLTASGCNGFSTPPPTSSPASRPTSTAPSLPGADSDKFLLRHAERAKERLKLGPLNSWPRATATASPSASICAPPSGYTCRPAVAGLTDERPVSRSAPSAGVAQERSALPQVGLPSSPDNLHFGVVEEVRCRARSSTPTG